VVFPDLTPIAEDSTFPRGNDLGNCKALRRTGEDTFVEEYQGIHRVILGRRSDLAVHGEVREKHSIFGSAGKRSMRDRM
jgi:hypothetical protein